MAEVELITLVEIPHAEQVMHRYPHELSGGMLQRIMTAVALSCDPKLIIADEPTTALDVTIQAQILDLLRDMKSNFARLFYSLHMTWAWLLKWLIM